MEEEDSKLQSTVRNTNVRHCEPDSRLVGADLHQDTHHTDLLPIQCYEYSVMVTTTQRIRQKIEVIDLPEMTTVRAPKMVPSESTNNLHWLWRQGTRYIN